MNYKQKNLIRRSFEKISAEALAESFYKHLFSMQPALRILFPDDFGAQKEKLALMLEASIEMLNEPENLVPFLEESGRRHALYGAREEHYETIGAALIASLREASGGEFTGETEAAWTKFYEEMSEIMKRGARRLVDAPEQYQEKNTEEKIKMKKQNAIVNMIRIFLMAVMLGLVSVAAANAETVFVANLDGQHVVPSNDTTGKGFAAIFVSDDEQQAVFHLYFSGLHSNSTTGAIHFPGTAGENVPPSLPITFNNGSSSLGWASSTFNLNQQQIQQLKNGLWYIKINSQMFPNGEIRGQFYPYSPFIAKLSGAQTVPANASTAKGAFYIAMNKEENLMIYYYKYSGLTQAPAKLSILSASAGQNGTWMLDATAADLPSSHSGIGYRPLGTSGGFTNPLKRGLLYAVVSTEQAYPVGEIRGQIKQLNKTTDFDGDNRAEISVFRESTGVWYQLNSLDNQFKATQFGMTGDVPAHADYDGDGVTDIAVYRANTGQFFVLRSKDNSIQIVQWGQAGDTPAVADFDGDGKADYVISRVSGQYKQFWIMGSNNNSIRAIQFGLNGDQFLPADFDGDRVNDLTVYRANNNTFYSILSSDGSYKVQKWGKTLDDPKIRDFDGDGKSDYAVYRRGGSDPELGTWWVLYNTGASVSYKFGFSSDIPVPSDYDGDGRTDFAIYRDGDWWIRKSSNGGISVTSFGLPSDTTITQ